LNSPVEGLILTYQAHDFGQDIFGQDIKERNFQHATTIIIPDFQVIHDTGIVRSSDGEEWRYISQVVKGRQVVFILR